MPIVAADILVKLSTKVGAAGNSTAGTPAGSLGKYVSTTQITDATLNNLFDTITGPENVASESEYRCIFVHNNHATLTLENAVIWIASQDAGGATIDISVDTTAASAVGAAPAQAKEIADENTAPAAQTFAGTAVSKATALSIGNLTPGQVRAVWLRRAAANTAADDLEAAILQIDGDTAA